MMMRPTSWVSGCLVLLSPLWVFAALAESQVRNKPYTEVPFDFVQGAIVLSVAVNGHGSFRMLLDTGVDPSVVDIATAKKIGLKFAAHGEASSGVGTEVNLAHRTLLKSVQLGELTATHVDAAAIDLSKVSAALGQPIDGVLGYSLLRRRIVQIDYPKRMVRFYKAAPRCTTLQSRDSRCTELTFVYKNDILANNVTVNGQPVVANFDTGSDAALEISPSTIERLSLSKDVARAHLVSRIGFNGEAKSSEGTVRSLTVGSFSIDQPAAVFYSKGMGVDDEPWNVRIGSAFLKDFAVTVDFRHNRIILVGQSGL